MIETEQLELDGVIHIKRRHFSDERGFFVENYRKPLYEKQGVTVDFVQDNQSSSLYGVIRGLHYQLEPYAQAILIRVLSGKLLDIVIAIRKGSPTYGESFSIDLSNENKKRRQTNFDRKTRMYVRQELGNGDLTEADHSRL